jgi:hypothetical protein
VHLLPSVSLFLATVHKVSTEGKDVPDPHYWSILSAILRTFVPEVTVLSTNDSSLPACDKNLRTSHVPHWYLGH